MEISFQQVLKVGNVKSRCFAVPYALCRLYALCENSCKNSSSSEDKHKAHQAHQVFYRTQISIHS